MAYGKIKADALIYDNSGSDVEKTIASLAAPTPEGTAVKSTGESGTTKFLRVDGDGTCSWQVPPDTQLTTEAVQDLVGAMVTGNTETGITVTYEDGDGTLDFVVGTLNQDTTGTAAIATEITATANNSTDETVYPVFVDGATGTQGIETDTGLTYNPSTGLLTAVGLTLSGNLTVNGTTTTINSTTLAVDDKNIELGTVDTPSDTTADGGGITLKGDTDKKITWNNTQNSWIFNQDIVVETGVLTVKGTEGGNANIYLKADEADDNADYWKIQHLASDNTVIFQNYTTGAYTTTLKLNPNGALEDSKGDVRKIPSNAQGGAYVAVAADAGKAIFISTGGVTINNSVFSAGDAVTIINNSGADQTITQGSGLTINNSADATTGNRTLAGRGMATIWFAGASDAYISGAGLT